MNLRHAQKLAAERSYEAIMMSCYSWSGKIGKCVCSMKQRRAWTGVGRVKGKHHPATAFSGLQDSMAGARHAGCS